jgi:hypothetical protein
MNPNDRTVDLPSETTEQALARVEAECGWSDIARFAEMPPAEAGTAGTAGERREA